MAQMPAVPTIRKLAIKLLKQLCVLTFCAVAGAPFWPLVWLGSLIWSRPPNMVHLTQVLRYLRYTWTEPLGSSAKPYARLWITLVLAQRLLISPLFGAAWLLDEVLFGRALEAGAFDDPFFLVSAARSGSTQLTRYIEADPCLVAPNVMMCLFPFLWLWRLAPLTLGRVLSRAKVRSLARGVMSAEFLERHEFDAFSSDTYDIAFFGLHHLNFVSGYLGPRVMAIELSTAEYAPESRSLFENDFVEIVDRLGRKTLLMDRMEKLCRQDQQIRSAVSEPSPRFYLKGHFLLAAPGLARRFPNANFLTVVRDPLERIASHINFMSTAPHTVPAIGPVPLDRLISFSTETESRYCGIEMEWYGDPGESNNRCVVRFQDYVDDLTGTMAKIYKECLQRQEEGLPPYVPLKHHPRVRSNYTVNRSLKDMGVDEQALALRLAAYKKWISD